MLQLKSSLIGIKTFIGAILLHLVHKGLNWLLRSTERIAANSVKELLSNIFKRFFKKENDMGFKKDIDLGKGFKLSITEADGVATVALSGDVPIEQLINAALDMAATKFPAASSLINAAKAGIDAAL